MGGFYIARLVLCFLMWGFGQKRLFLVLRDSPFFLSPGQRDFFFKPLYDAGFGILHWNTLSRILQDSFSFPLFGRSSINSWHHQVVAKNNWLMGCFLTVLFTDVEFVQDIFDLVSVSLFSSFKFIFEMEQFGKQQCWNNHIWTMPFWGANIFRLG